MKKTKNKTVYIRIPKINKKVVLVEFDNCSPFVYVITSTRPITIDRVAGYFEKMEGWNEDRDSLTIVGDTGEISELSIDRKPRA